MKGFIFAFAVCGVLTSTKGKFMHLYGKVKLINGHAESALIKCLISSCCLLA